MSQLEQRPPPHNVDAERGVLGAMLLDSSTAQRARTLLSRGDFYLTANAALFDAIITCWDTEGSVDTITLLDYLRGTQSLDDVGGMLYVTDLSAQAVTAANFRHHVAIVTRKAAARQGMESAASLLQQLQDDDGADPDTVLTRHVAHTTGITGSRSTVGLSTADVMVAADGQYTEAHKRFQAGIPYAGLDSGMAPVNDMLGGLCPEELTVLAARPSIGKTTLAWQWGLHAAANGHRVAGISLEMSRTQVGGLWLRIRGNLPPTDYRQGNLSPEADGRRQQASSALQRQDLTLVDDVPMTIAQVQSTIHAVEQVAHVDLWIIDYLQLIVNDGSDGELDVISQVLKSLTLEHSTHIVLISQLNRDCERRSDRRPSLADLRGSGGIEQNANNVILIHRPGFYPEIIREVKRQAIKDARDPDVLATKMTGQVGLLFSKTRNGPTGEAGEMEWNPDMAQFQPRSLENAF